MTNNKKTKRKSKVFTMSLLSILIIVVMTFSIGKYWIEIIDKYNEKKLLDEELIALKEKEEELKVDANKLQNPDYIARYAREKYSYSKEGEYIIKIPDE